MEIGIYSFGEVADPTASSAAQRLRELIEEITLADQVGLEVFGALGSASITAPISSFLHRRWCWPPPPRARSRFA
jgi:hypothetical protein